MKKFAALSLAAIPSLFLFLLLLLPSLASAQQKKTAAPAPAAPRPAPALDLQDGDTLVFLGDSITHQCLYTQYIEDFFYTRYPDRRIRFHNSGVSGDRAQDALTRFEDDVAAFQPKVVTLLLGMNDGAYEDFNAETFAAYAEGMTRLLDQIEALGAKPVVMSPTMFDHHQLALQMKNPEYRFRTRSFSGQYNALLAFYGGWLRERAGERGLPFADQWAPMNQQTFAQRRRNPDFTLVSDAIHPAPAGHFLMAYELLWQVSPDRKNVSGISIIPTAKGWHGSPEVSDIVVSETKDHATFTHTARSLPWAVTEKPWEKDGKWDAEPGARVGYQMTAAGHRLSNERIKIAGLAPGDYDLKIDGVNVGTYSHLALGAKVELQSNEKTPQYQQALDVAKLNRERNDKAVRPSRDIWAKLKGLGKREKATRDLIEAAKTAVASETADKIDNGAILERIVADREAAKSLIAEKLELSQSYVDRIYEAAQPKPRKYELTRVP